MVGACPFPGPGESPAVPGDTSPIAPGGGWRDPCPSFIASSRWACSRIAAAIASIQRRATSRACGDGGRRPPRRRPSGTSLFARDRAKAAGKSVELVIYPEAPHGFHADYRPSYRREAAEDGWARALAFLKSHGVG